MKRDKCPVSCKAQSRIKAAAEQIRIVRRDRGSAAHGDSLIDSALRSMSGGNTREAMIALEKFRHCPDLSNAHATLIDIACRHIRSKWVWVWIILRYSMKPVSWAIGIWKTLATGNPINSYVMDVRIFLWIYRMKQWRLSHAGLA